MEIFMRNYHVNLLVLYPKTLIIIHWVELYDNLDTQLHILHLLLNLSL